MTDPNVAPPVALSTPTATSPRVETSGEPETATASPAQFEQAVDEFERAIEQHEDAVDDAFLLEGDLTDRTPPSDNPRVTAASADLLAARQALLSLFSKAAGAPTRADRTETAHPDSVRLDWLDAEHDRVDPVMRLVVKRDHDRNSSEWANTMDARAAIDTAMQAALAALNPPSAGGPPQSIEQNNPNAEAQ